MVDHLFNVVASTIPVSVLNGSVNASIVLIGYSHQTSVVISSEL